MKSRDFSPPKNIVIRMPNWIGDFVMATPLITDLRKSFPEATITAMCQHPLGELLTCDPEINELFTFRKPPFFFRRDERRGFLEKIRKASYDWGVLTTNSFSSAWWFWQGKVERRVGFARDTRRFLLTHPVAWESHFEKLHLVNVYKQLLVPLGIPPSTTSPRLFISEEERKQANELLKKLEAKEKIVGINPGAAYGTAKCWLPERFREVTKNLIDHPDVSVVYFGDPSMKGLVGEICKDFPKSVINLAGHTSLRQLLALIERCDVLLTNDSGPMHVASALATPVVALFGSTSSIKTGPYRGGKVVQKQVSCSPCFKKICPIDFRCMKEITVQEVLGEIEQMLEMRVKVGDD